jgi:hypothetical protein
VGETTSYAERLFTFPEIGPLSDDDAASALADPASELGVRYEPEAVSEALAFTEGYPHLPQEVGYVVWSIADGDLVRRQGVVSARGSVEEKLDSSFFRVRLDRATPLEGAYLRAMAELGSDPQLARDVGDPLNRTSEQRGPTFDARRKGPPLYSSARLSGLHGPVVRWVRAQGGADPRCSACARKTVGFSPEGLSGKGRGLDGVAQSDPVELLHGSGMKVLHLVVDLSHGASRTASSLEL